MNNKKKLICHQYIIIYKSMQKRVMKFSNLKNRKKNSLKKLLFYVAIISGI